MKITIHIERLSVEGTTYGAAGAAALQAALSRELSRLVASDAGLRAALVPTRLGHLACDQSAAGSGPSVLGASVASALHAGLNAGLGVGGPPK